MIFLVSTGIERGYPRFMLAYYQLHQSHVQDPEFFVLFGTHRYRN